MKELYFDNAATTKVDEEVLKTMIPYFCENYGNPSAIYGIARKSKKALEEAREEIASIINCNPQEVYFTSGGSESDNTAIKGIARANKNRGNHIITSKIEHPAVLETCKELEKEGFEITYVSVDKNGVLNMDELRNSIKENTILISVMYANNEIGTIQNIEQIGDIARSKNIYFHTDAVQAAGILNIDVEKQNIDSLSISSHKFYGPKGMGVLYVKKGVKFENIIDGGHQERGKRAGTENVASIVGMAKAMRISKDKMKEHFDKIKELRDYYEEQVLKRIPYVKINGDLQNRLPGTSNISFRFIEGEGLLLNLDLKGICASSGSACTSGSLDPSHVLLAIGLPHEIAHGSLRISIGKYNTKEEIDILVDNLVEIVARLRDMSPLYEKFLEEEKS